MRNFSFQKQILTGFVLCVLFVFILAIISYFSLRKMQSDAVWVDRTAEVISRVGLIENYVVTAESRQRAFVAKGNEESLQAYQKATDIIIPAINELKVLAQDNPKQSERVDSLEQYALRKLLWSGSVINSRKNSFQEAQTLMQTGNGDILMDKIRNKINEITMDEKKLWAQRKLISDNSVNRSILIIMFGCLITLILILILFNYIRKTFREQKIVEENFRGANAQLENYQQELIKAKNHAEQAKRIKEDFLANMSHEIRTPINGIIGLAYMLKNTNLTREQEGICDLLDISSKSLLGVINDILDISKIEAGKFKIVRSETNVIQLAQSVIDLLKFRTIEKNLDLILEIAPDFPQIVIADSLRLNQILMNLISNGIKFTEKGYVKLELKVLNWKANKAQIEFSVTDTGIGIEADKIDKIFVSYEQADDITAHHYGGTGLGLSIVKKLVELKGGILTVNSTKKAGSKFTFTNWYQVVSVKNTKADTQRSAADLPKFSNLSILVGEDNVVNQFMIKKILSSWNIKVDMVENGLEVFNKLEENNYDLILIDTHMPVMNGYEAVRKIRSEMSEEKRNIPIISLSAAVLEEEQKAAIDAGVNDILSKPFDPIVLYYKIEKLAGKG